jgi:hypothetical protein
MSRVKLLLASLVTLTLAFSLFGPPIVANAKTKCTKTELAQYKKAQFQYINANTIIQSANEIKKIVEDARQKKSALLGKFVDYTAKDLYTLNKQDTTIRETEDFRDTWEPTLKKLSKKCGFPMTLKSEVKGGNTNTSSSNQATPSPSAYSRQFLTIQDYFDRIPGTYFATSRQFTVTCINDARRDGIVDGLKVYLAISSNSTNLQTGQEWFPTQFTNSYVSKIKTWTNGKSHLYVELPFSAPDDNRNPCGLTVDNVPRLSEIGPDVNTAIFLVAGPTGYAVASKSMTKAELGG